MTSEVTPDMSADMSADMSPDMSPDMSTEATWTPICAVDDLAVDRGAAALLDGHQVAVFRLASGEVYAVGHRDPFSGANVMARGLVGTRGDIPTVASPIYKQSFDLRTGQCLDEDAVALGSWPVRVVDGIVELMKTDGL